jgi:cytochrome c-type biogenesis protein CcmH
MWRSCLLILSLLLGFTNISWADIDTYEFANETQRQRYYSFIQEMRCPKCENQSLGGSNSPIAMELRHQLYLMIDDGRSDKEIIDFMVERYGDYILYRPRVMPVTLLLWFGPGLLLIIGIIILIVTIRSRRRLAAQTPSPALSAEEQARLAELLRSESTSSTNRTSRS